MEPITYVARDEHDEVDKILVEKMAETAKKVYENFKISAEMIFGEIARKLHESATACFACKKFDGDKVRDQCHYTGKYRGALHSGCNLKLGERTLIIPVLAPNNSGYDSHMFVKRLADTKRRTSCGERGKIHYFQQGYPCGRRGREKGLRQTKISGYVQVYGQVAGETGQNHNEVRAHGQILHFRTTGTDEEEGGVSVRLHE